MNQTLNDKKVLVAAYAVAGISLLILVLLITKANYWQNNQKPADQTTDDGALTEAEKNRILDSLRTERVTAADQSIFDGPAPVAVDQKRERAILKSLETSAKPALTVEQRQAILQSLQSAN